MPALQPNHIEGLSPLIFAFEGQKNKDRNIDVLEGEKENDLFFDFISDGRNNGYPKQFHNHLLVSDEELETKKIKNGNSYPLKCFLWVIDQESIKIIWEMTTNIKRKSLVPKKPYVCHTNITGIEGKAYIGGELYFCENGEIYVNFNSGRFGIVASEEKKRMAIQYIKDCEFKNVVRVDFQL
ncbi:hypothetical protein HQN86_24825 [Pedobacter panaciterrae]|uniref:hypothetical protein n=1 Tax=Pedobacter panaciterrae TaxID=363849 RepID=UPI00155DC4F4|nr:hypothetical protein [Pedobacter panaciterrae]NQX56865.1 hypothetical protein [Pedobacter panaciterrae]